MSQKKSTDEDVIIDAEIIEETPQAPKAEKGATTQASFKTSDSSLSKNTAARIGWGVVLLLIAFVGGIFMEPLAEQGLKRLGLIKKTDSAPREAQLQIDLTPLKETQTQQNERLKLLETTFQAQSEIIQSLKNENVTLKHDITTFAAGMPPAGQSALPTRIISDMSDRMTQIEAVLQDVKINAVQAETQDNVVIRLEGELKLARAETAQLLERLVVFEKSVELSQSQKLSDSPEGRAAITLHHLYLNATSGANYSADIAALKPDLINLPLLDIQPVSRAMVILETNQGGIATHSALVREFNALIPSLLGESVAGESTGWLANFFTIRRTDARAEGVEAVIRSIEVHLANRDLVAALAEVNSLPDSLKSVTKDWQNKLLAREATLSALTDLLETLAGGAS